MKKRSDTPKLISNLTEALNLRIGIIFMFLLSLALCVVIVMLVNKPRLVTMIDMSTGKTYSAMGYSKISQEAVNRQVIYYSRDFCEKYYSRDYQTIVADRKEAKKLMYYSLAETLPKNFLNGETIKTAQQKKTISFFDWKIKPIVTSQNDPRYSSFCQFTRKTMLNNRVISTKNFNIRLDWGRFVENTEPFERPHALVLLNFTELKTGSQEYNYQLQQIK